MFTTYNKAVLICNCNCSESVLRFVEKLDKNDNVFSLIEIACWSDDLTSVKITRAQNKAHFAKKSS